MQTWPAQGPKARFSERLETRLAKGPQRMTKRVQKLRGDSR